MRRLACESTGEREKGRGVEGGEGERDGGGRRQQYTTNTHTEGSTCCTVGIAQRRRREESGGLCRLRRRGGGRTLCRRRRRRSRGGRRARELDDEAHGALKEQVRARHLCGRAALALRRPCRRRVPMRVRVRRDPRAEELGLARAELVGCVADRGRQCGCAGEGRGGRGAREGGELGRGEVRGRHG